MPRANVFFHKQYFLFQCRNFRGRAGCFVGFVSVTSVKKQRKTNHAHCTKPNTPGKRPGLFRWAAIRWLVRTITAVCGIYSLLATLKSLGVAVLCFVRRFSVFSVEKTGCAK